MNEVFSARDPAWLLEHAHNVHSQFGEDGVLLAALELLPQRDHCCVEFGAWDGLHLSNTANLIRNHGYRGVLIEGDAAKVEELSRNHTGFPGVSCLCRMVGWGPEDGLDAILAGSGLPADFDLLSIDIDGNDWHVWKALQNFRPKMVIVEFNQTIPTEVDYCQPRDPRLNIGSSIQALVRLGGEKGYQLVSVLRNNLLFVRTEYYPLFGIGDNRPQTLRRDSQDVTWIFSGYDGSVHLAGSGRLPWHDLALQSGRMQPLPRYLRVFPPGYSSLQSFLFRCLRWWRRGRDRG